jgi:hypothetical protein
MDRGFTCHVVACEWVAGGVQRVVHADLHEDGGEGLAAVRLAGDLLLLQCVISPRDAGYAGVDSPIPG